MNDVETIIETQKVIYPHASMWKMEYLKDCPLEKLKQIQEAYNKENYDEATKLANEWRVLCINKLNAKMQIETSKYSDEIIAEMKIAFDNGDYNKVNEIAYNNDVPKREKLDDLIKMFPNPNFKDNSHEIETSFLQKLGYSTDNESIDDGFIDNVPFLFSIEGIDKHFTSASEAIKAYKEKHNIKENIGSHSFRYTYIVP